MTDEMNGHAPEASPLAPAPPVTETPGPETFPAEARRHLGLVRKRRLLEGPIEVTFPRPRAIAPWWPPVRRSYRARRSSNASAIHA